MTSIHKKRRDIVITADKVTAPTYHERTLRGRTIGTWETPARERKEMSVIITHTIEVRVLEKPIRKLYPADISTDEDDDIDVVGSGTVLSVREPGTGTNRVEYLPPTTLDEITRGLTPKELSDVLHDNVLKSVNVDIDKWVASLFA